MNGQRHRLQEVIRRHLGDLSADDDTIGIQQIDENDKMIFCDSLLSQFLLKFNQLRISLFPMELTKSP